MDTSQPGEGRHFGTYTLVRELGRGGQGTVWLAEDMKLKRQVALKLLSKGPGSIAPERLHRFKRESEAAARLDDPHICALLDAGDVDGAPYLAFRHLEGETLAARIARAYELRAHSGPSPSAEPAASPPHSQSTTDPSSREGIDHLVRTFEKLARALHKAHERGLIHRDVKPGNIMITPEGEPVILDFGLAHDELTEQQSLTHSGDLLGTPAYMSPEQLTAQRIPLDRRTDVYSLGATLYEALTLQKPFTAPTRAELYQKILTSDPSSTSSINRQIPHDLQVVVETAMEKDRNRRYQTALDFAEDLRRLSEFQPIHAKPISSLLRLRRWTQRHPALATGVIAAFVLLSGGLTVSLAMLEKVTSARAAAEANERTAQDALAAAFLEKADRAIRDGDHSAAAIFASAALWHDPSNPHGPRYRPLDGVRAQERDEVRRAFMYSRLFEAEARRRVTYLRTLDFPAGPIGHNRPLIFAPKGDALAVGGAEGQVTVCHIYLATPPVTLRARRPRGDRVSLAWSQDARVLADATGDAVLLWDVDEARAIGEIGRGEHPTCAAFSPDGRTIAVGDHSGRIHFWSRAGLEPESDAIELSSRRIHAITYSPAGRHVAAVGTEPFVWVYDCKERRVAWSRELPIWGTGVEYSPDGNTLAAAVLDNAIWLFDSNSGERVARYPTGMPAVGVTWSPDGKWLLHGGSGGAMVGVADGHTIDILRNPIDRHHYLDLSADGGVIAAMTSDVPGIRLFRVGDAGLTLRFPGHRRFMLGIAQSGNGRTVVTTSPYDGLTRMWNLPESPMAVPADLTRATLREFEGGKDAAAKPYQVALSPDGTLLATASLYGRTELRSLPEGRLLHVIQEASNQQTYSAWDVDFSPDGRWLYAAGADGRILRWSIVDQAFAAPLVSGGGQVFSVACSGDGRSFAAGSRDGVVRVWDLADLSAAPRALRGHNGLVSGLSFSPSGRQLASGGWDATIRVWDLDTAQEIVRRQHDLWVSKVRYSPDGRFLLSASDDNTARLWSTTDYRLLQVFRGVDQVQSVVFSLDSRYFYMNDGTDLVRHRIVVDERIDDPVRLLHDAERAAGMRLEGLELVPIR